MSNARLSADGWARAVAGHDGAAFLLGAPALAVPAADRGSANPGTKRDREGIDLDTDLWRLAAGGSFG